MFTTTRPSLRSLHTVLGGQVDPERDQTAGLLSALWGIHSVYAQFAFRDVIVQQLTNSCGSVSCLLTRFSEIIHVCLPDLTNTTLLPKLVYTFLKG